MNLYPTDSCGQRNIHITLDGVSVAVPAGETVTQFVRRFELDPDRYTLVKEVSFAVHTKDNEQLKADGVYAIVVKPPPKQIWEHERA